MDPVQDMLRKWRENRAAHPHRDAVGDRRRIDVKGREVVVVRKKPKPRVDSAD